MDNKLHRIVGTLELRSDETGVLELRFGLRDGRPKTLAEVSEILNLPRERIRELEALALRELRRKPPGA